MINLNNFDLTQDTLPILNEIITNKNLDGYNIHITSINIKRMTLNNSLSQFPMFLHIKGKSCSTKEAYLGDIQFFYRFLKEHHKRIRYVHEITTLEILDYKKYLLNSADERKLQISTIKRKFNSLKTFFKYLDEYKYIKENPVKNDNFGNRNNTIAKLPDYLKQHEIDMIIATIRHQNSNNKYRDISLIETLRNLGCRRSEALSLCWDKIDFYDKTITITRTKTKNQDVLPMNDRLCKALIDYRDSLGINISSSVFLSREGNPLSKSAFNSMFKKYVQLSGLQTNKSFNITAHTLRHSFITEMAKAGQSLQIIIKFTGHVDSRSLETYTHFCTSDLRNAVDNFNKNVPA